MPQRQAVSRLAIFGTASKRSSGLWGRCHSIPNAARHTRSLLSRSAMPRINFTPASEFSALIYHRFTVATSFKASQGAFYHYHRALTSSDAGVCPQRNGAVGDEVSIYWYRARNWMSWHDGGWGRPGEFGFLRRHYIMRRLPAIAAAILGIERRAGSLPATGLLASPSGPGRPAVGRRRLAQAID